MAYFFTKSKEPKRKPIGTWLTFSQRVRNRKGSQVLGLLFHKEQCFYSWEFLALVTFSLKYGAESKLTKPTSEYPFQDVIRSSATTVMYTNSMEDHKDLFYQTERAGSFELAIHSFYEILFNIITV